MVEDKEQPLDLNDDKVISDEGAKQTSSYQLLSTTRQHGSKFNRYVIGCALLASLSSVLLGYDVGIMSGAVLFIEEDLKIHELQEEVLVGSLSLVSLVGGFMAGRFSDAVGRKKTMAVASIIFLLGAAVMGLAPSFAVLMLGRVVTGIGVGFGLMIAPVYTAELAPSATRGALVTFPEVFINFGILLGYIVSYLLSGFPAGISWRLMLGAGCIPAILLAFAVMFMPESPRWLVMQNRIEEAEVILMKTSSGKQEADQRLLDIMAAAGAAGGGVAGPEFKELNSLGGHAKIRKSKGEGVWRELLFPIPSVRRMLIVALGVQFFQQASGIDALVYYSPAVFNEAGITSKAGLLGTTVAVGFTKTIFILVATIWLDRVGRRPLLLLSSIGMTASLITIALGFAFFKVESTDSGHHHLPVQSSGTGGGSEVAVALTIVAICLFMAFFSIGFGPICWVLTSEVFPLRLRAQAASFAIAVNRVVSGIVALTFLSVSEAITPAGSFFLFAGVSAAAVVFVYFFVPETKGKSLEEITKSFEHEESHEQFGASGIELGEAHPFNNEGVHSTANGNEFPDEDDIPVFEGSTGMPVYDGAARQKLLAKVKSIAAKQGSKAELKH